MGVGRDGAALRLTEAGATTAKVWGASGFVVRAEPPGAARTAAGGEGAAGCEGWSHRGSPDVNTRTPGVEAKKSFSSAVRPGPIGTRSQIGSPCHASPRC